MKRFSEKFKQSLGIGVGSKTKEWKPTSNARNEACLKEVRKFAQQLKAFQKECKDLQTAVDSGLSTFKSVLNSPLPRAHDDTPAGIMPIEPVEHTIGLTVNADLLQVANADQQQRLRQDVIEPLEQWLSEYRKTKELHKTCEKIRFDLDDKRRTVTALQEKYQKYKDHNHKETEATMHKVQNEEDKLNRLAQRYAEKEAEVFNAYLRLIRDSAVLREFIASALGIFTRCFTMAYSAFEVAAPPPMPMLPAPTPVPQIEYKPADINASQRYTAAATAAAAATLAAPAPLARGLSVRQNNSMSAPGAPPAAGLGPSATFAAYGSAGGAAAGAAGAAAAPGAYPSIPGYNAAGAATMPAGTIYNPNTTTYSTSPPSPNASSIITPLVVAAPAPAPVAAPPSIPTIPEHTTPSLPPEHSTPTPPPAPATPAAPANPATPTPVTPPQTLPNRPHEEPAIALPPPASAWTSSKPPHPPSENGSIDSDTNPFITNPAPEAPCEPPPPEKEPSGDPANPFKHNSSEDGRQAVPA